MKRTAQRPGKAAVELAVILPVLMTLILGCIDFGRFASTDIAVSNAARVGADVGSNSPYSVATRPRWEAAIRAAIVQELASIHQFDVELMTVTITTHDDGDERQRIEVRVDYPFRSLIHWPAVPDEVLVYQSVVVRSNRP